MLGDRFWSKVDKTEAGCWLWTASTNPKGYGKYGIDYTWKLAHRVAYEDLVGEIPAGGRLLHECDTPACVRPGPKHVVLGTITRNNRDARDRRRYVKRPGLTRESAQVIRAEFTGAPGQVKALAERFGVGRVTIWRVISGRSWREE